MKVLVSWLREFVAVPGTPEDIAATMSVRGFAVEGIEPVGSDDAVLDFEITANRPDCMSVLGVAREVATAYGLPLTLPGAADRQPLRSVEQADIDVVIESAELCPRYAGAVADVTVQPSPAWMQARLVAAGVRPISNIVDITNYVLLELGQPMHAFDLSKLSGAQIRVRQARPGETMTTLDGQKRTLTPEMLVIADAERPVAVAGVMGGADSEVTAATTTLVFESAYFNPLTVRRTSRKLGLKTEASMRYERGSDPQLPLIAMERACELLEMIGAGRARGTVVDRQAAPAASTVLRLRRARIGQFLGAAIPDADTVGILERLGFGLSATSDGWDVVVPTRRVDVLREVDLIEEVARHWGLDNLPTTFPPLVAPVPMSDPRIRRARQLRTLLTAHGFSEAVTFGFVAEAAAAPFADEGDLVPIANPLSENFAVLRASVLPGILDAVAHNRRREQRDVRLFEIGARFSRAHGERRALACAWTGAASVGHWSGGARDVDFFDMKGLVEGLGVLVRLELTLAPQQASWLVPGRSAAVVAGETPVGLVGQLTADVGERHGLPGGDAVYVLEVDLEAIDALAPATEPRVTPLPRYPSVVRDVSILVDDTLPAARVRQTIAEAAPATLTRVTEFDRYQGKGVPDGKVSLSLRLTFRSPDRTLTDAEVHEAMTAVVAALVDRHAATQR
jgi:phenylalanyl-tRNA synthetase beta chain